MREFNSKSWTTNSLASKHSSFWTTTSWTRPTISNTTMAEFVSATSPSAWSRVPLLIKTPQGDVTTLRSSESRPDSHPSPSPVACFMTYHMPSHVAEPGASCMASRSPWQHVPLALSGLSSCTRRCEALLKTPWPRFLAGIMTTVQKHRSATTRRSLR